MEREREGERERGTEAREGRYHEPCKHIIYAKVASPFSSSGLGLGHRHSAGLGLGVLVVAACVTVWDGASGELRERGRVLGGGRHPKVLPGGPLPWGRGEGERLGRVLGALLGRLRGVQEMYKKL